VICVSTSLLNCAVEQSEPPRVKLGIFGGLIVIDYSPVFNLGRHTPIYETERIMLYAHANNTPTYHLGEMYTREPAVTTIPITDSKSLQLGEQFSPTPTALGFFMRFGWVEWNNCCDAAWRDFARLLSLHDKYLGFLAVTGIIPPKIGMGNTKYFFYMNFHTGRCLAQP
jgi:hypothetical protein